MSFSGVADALTLSYMAGIMDGEGCFSVGVKDARNHTPMLSVGMVDKEIPNLFKEVFGGNVYIDDAGYRPIYKWNLRNFVRISEATSAMLPYLRIKKPQAEIILEFVDKELPRSGKKIPEEELLRRAALKERIKILNLVGKEYIKYHNKEKHL